ncbi:MAG: protein kinase, partial [Myxococcota bacterium]
MAGQRIKIGGWRVEATLGQGGMGVVYLARHAESGQRAALKTLLASPQRFDIASLRSEIAILRELDHPGVITLLDHGVDTLPWMAMERVVGQPLSAHMAGSSATLHKERSSSAASWLGTQPLLTASSHGSGERALKGEATLEAGSTLHPDNSMWSETLAPDSAVDTSPPDTPHIPPPSALVMEAAPLAPVLIPEEPDIRQKVLLGYMGQVCQALAYVHGQGIVHADVKPGNVLVSEQGRAVLVDFGLATPFGNRVDVSAMDRAGLLAGSVSYIAPEQIGGEELDARADLYALGCILCEVLTGRPPFTGLAREMLEQHLHAAPPNLPDTVPQEMRELVARLLAKDRLSRPGHAQVVVHTLEQLGVEVLELPASYRPQPYLYRPRLAGRQALMGHLMTHLVEGADGGLTLLCGESGIGKTHVAMEVVREARQRSSHIVLLGHGSRLGTGDEQQARQPLSLFRSILRQIADMCVASGPRSAQRVFGSDAAILKPVAPFVANLPGIEPAQELPEMAADAARMRLFGAWVRVLRRYCATKPTLMVLDDVQWADDLSLRALRYLLGELAAVPWRIICTCRAEQVPPAIEALRELRSCEWLDVPRLDERAVGEIVAQMLGQAPEGLVSVVSRRGGGNAFFVAEYLRTAVEQELLTMDEAGRWILATGDGQEIDTRLATLPEPGSVMELITARLARLKPRERLLCDAAAVVGREVPLDLLAQVAQTPLGAME